MTASQSVITLITDFGLDDEYVGALKGVILSHSTKIHTVDISHSVSRQDILGASRLLSRSFSYFPHNTVHLVVVDPGVGTKRAILAISAGGYFFVGPDNGVLTSILDRYPATSSIHRVSRSSLFLRSVSNTFHGRDIMAPVAAHLATGLALDKVGPAVRIDECTIARFPSPALSKDGLQGVITHVDIFGNLATNLSRQEVENFACSRKFAVRVGETVIENFCSSYAATPPGALLTVYDSHEFLEISLNMGDAARHLNISTGEYVTVVIAPL